MLIQSNGGKVYAVIANNHDYELALLPTFALHSTTVFLQIRCRFKALTATQFDPMLTPKRVLVGGIERSNNTLRGTIMLNTGFTLDKVGSGFPQLVAQKLFDAAPNWLLPFGTDDKGTGPNGETPTEHVALYSNSMRDDFVQDFAQLVAGVIEPFYPAKDFSGANILMTSFDLGMFATTDAVAPPSPFTSVTGGKVDAGPVVQKIIPGDDEPVPPAPKLETNVHKLLDNIVEKAGVDNEAGSENPKGEKVKLLGKIPETDPPH